MLFTVIETPTFIKKAQGILSEEEFDALRYHVALSPYDGALIKGSGGLRKLRYKIGGRGKNGSTRVITFALTRKNEIFLLDIYDKTNKENISKKDMNDLAKLLDGLK